jgi:uncharacterized protein (TIGR02757 family)
MAVDPDLGAGLDRLYRKFNRRAFVHPDPLEIVYRWADPRDQEIAGLLSAALAYGRVAQILASVEAALARLSGTGGGPRAWIEGTAERRLRAALAGFRHRFTPGDELADLVVAVRRALREHGSLEALFAAGCRPDDATVLPGLTLFVERLRRYAGGPGACPTLLASPSDGSACKRLNLYLRWMIRRDAVDPGPWSTLPASRLVVPLDTHMFRIARALGLTDRATPGLKTAMEITEGFSRYSPKDPVRYDFCLTRLGINPSCHDEELERIIDGDVEVRRVRGRTKGAPFSAGTPSSPSRPARGRKRS